VQKGEESYQRKFSIRQAVPSLKCVIVKQFGINKLAKIKITWEI